MTGPIIEHLDAFEEEIAAICRGNVILDRNVARILDAAKRREEELTDWYAEERASRTGGP